MPTLIDRIRVAVIGQPQEFWPKVIATHAQAGASSGRSLLDRYPGHFGEPVRALVSQAEGEGYPGAMVSHKPIRDQG